MQRAMTSLDTRLKTSAAGDGCNAQCPACNRTNAPNHCGILHHNQGISTLRQKRLA